MTLNAIDISAWQATTPSLKGLSAAFDRATFGTLPDRLYPMHTANFRKAALVAAGAYAFGTGVASGSVQAHAFLAVASASDILALDLERNGGGTSMTWAQAREFIKTVQATGRKIGLYHSRSGFPQLGQDWDWPADWTSAPTPPGATFRQYRGSPLDLDHFIGDLAALRKLAGKAPARPVTYHLRFTGGAFFVYEVNAAGHITRRHAHRFGAPTGAPCGPLKHTPSDDAAIGPRWLTRVTAGALKGQLVAVPQSTIRFEVIP